MSDVNFHIVENYQREVDYEEFKEDFLNPCMSVDEICEKHELTPSMWRDNRAKVLCETGLSRKPAHTHKPSPFLLGRKTHIQKKKNGWIVVKITNGNYQYCGKYPSFETAEMVRDKLIECNWDQEQMEKLKQKYGVRFHRVSSLEWLDEYPRFEKLYFDKSLTIKDIMKMMGLSSTSYGLLLKRLREIHGKDMHRSRIK